MKAAGSSFDVIIDTAPVKHDVSIYAPLLDVDGTLVVLGQVGPLDELMSVPLVFGRRRVAGPFLGGIAETQDVLNFCAKHNVYPDCEMIRIDQINDAFFRLKQGDLAHRFVIDMSSLTTS